ncbi:MAG: NAD(P)-binding protein [Phycisphaerales bacterium]|nr:NAD(P)-binding protein [Phycisphaerales bacterium]
MNRPTSRREFLGRGLAALALGAAGGAGGLGRAHGAIRIGNAFLVPPTPPCLDTGALPRFAAGPFANVDYQPRNTVEINGLPFANQWFGDLFDPASIPFHSAENTFPGGQPPAPSESADIVVVGAGLSGLTTAYLLRHRDPVLFELHQRVGGTSMGERWRGLDYSLGGAYFITPDDNSDLYWLYRALGVDRKVRVSPNTDDPVEVNGAIDPGFWFGDGLPEAERAAFQEYAALVAEYADNYPDIPLDDTLDNKWIRDLDRLSLRNHIVSRMSVPVPARLHAAIQGYCYSSFNAGWEEISAASGWNFLAAEEYGRWVLPGGNAGLADALWQQLQGLESKTPPGCPPQRLRVGCRVVDVRVLGPERVLVTYKDSAGAFRSLLAKRVAICTPKHVARHLIHNWRNDDPERFELSYDVHTAAYVVANVLLTRPIRRDFYDLFLLKDGLFPDALANSIDPGHFKRVIDAVRGDFTRRAVSPKGVLTLYWPLPYASGRFDVLFDHGFNDFATLIGPELDLILNLLGLARRDVSQIRLSRWGHSMPIARPNLLADGVLERLRAPYRDHIFFVNQDNWCLPAVETALLEAFAMKPLIEEGL